MSWVWSKQNCLLTDYLQVCCIFAYFSDHTFTRYSLSPACLDLSVFHLVHMKGKRGPLRGLKQPFIAVLPAEATRYWQRRWEVTSNSSTYLGSYALFGVKHKSWVEQTAQRSTFKPASGRAIMSRVVSVLPVRSFIYVKQMHSVTAECTVLCSCTRLPTDSSTWCSPEAFWNATFPLFQCSCTCTRIAKDPFFLWSKRTRLNSLKGLAH